jgi:N-acetylmuramoyl-L-alanine amidase
MPTAVEYTGAAAFPPDSQPPSALSAHETAHVGQSSPATKAPGGPDTESSEPEPKEHPLGKPVGSDEDRVVSAGECVSSIAKDTGHFWKTIWDDGKNAELKQLRKDPNVLLPGDRIYVPPLRMKEEPGATSKKHRFRRLGEPSKLVIRLLRKGKPRAGLAWKLEVDGKTFSGAADAQGYIRIPIPGNAKRGLLILGQGAEAEEHEIGLGQLDPVEATTGLQARLANLGYGCEVNGNLDEETLAAVRSFRIDNKVGKPDDPLDDNVRQKIREKHGS